MLPLRPRRTGQDVGGAGLKGEFGRLPGARPATAEPHPARGQQRDATDVAELRRVAVPADPRAGRIARHEQIHQFLGLVSHQPGAARPEPLQLGRDRCRRAAVVPAGHLGQAEASYQPPRRRVVQHVRMQFDRRQHRQQVAFLVLGEEAGPVAQSLRQRHAPSMPRSGAPGTVGGRQCGRGPTPDPAPCPSGTRRPGLSNSMPGSKPVSKENFLMFSAQSIIWPGGPAGRESRCVRFAKWKASLRGAPRSKMAR